MKSRMKIYFTAIIILSMLLTGCANKKSENSNVSNNVDNTVSQDEVASEDEVVNEEKLDDKIKEPVVEEEENDKELEEKESEEDATESGQGNEVENSNEQLAELLPSEIGYTWEYTGSFEYEHTATLDSIDKNEDELIYYVSGEVKEYVQEEDLNEPFMIDDGQTEDMTAEDTEGENIEGQQAQENEEYDELDNSIELQYIIKDGVLVQKKKSIAMMDTFFDELILIKAPLEETTTWTQQLEDVEGNQYNMKGTITWKRVKDGKTLYNVEYKDVDGDRYEERVIEEGVGVVDYKSKYYSDGLMMEYGYDLKE